MNPTPPPPPPKKLKITTSCEDTRQPQASRKTQPSRIVVLKPPKEHDRSKPTKRKRNNNTNITSITSSKNKVKR